MTRVKFGRVLGCLALFACLSGQAAWAQNVAPTGNYSPDPDTSSTEGSPSNGTATSDPPGLFSAELSLNSGSTLPISVSPVGGMGAFGVQNVACGVTRTSGDGTLAVVPSPISLLAGSGAVVLTLSCLAATAQTRGLMTCNESPKPPATGTNVTVWWDVQCNSPTSPEFDSTPAGGTPINLSATVGGSAMQGVTVNNTGNAALTVQPGGLTAPLAISPNGLTTINAGGNQAFTVTCSPTSVGATTQTLSFDTNDPDEDPVTYQVTCTGTAAAAPQYASTPAVGSTIPISAQVAGSANATLTINNPGTQPLTAAVSGLSTVLGFAPAGPFTIAAGGNQVLTITCTPASATTVVQTLSVDHNDNDGAPPDPATYQVQCTGTSAPQAEYTSLPTAGSTITLAAAVLGTDTDIVAVSNTGGAGTTLTSNAAGLSGVLAVAPASHSAGQGQSDDYTITCMPTGAGRVTQTLTITSNDANEGTNVYTVNCDGLTAEFTSTPNAPGPLAMAAAQNATDPTTLLTIGNDGAAGNTLTYSAPAGLSGALSITPTIGGSLAPGATQPFTITCDSASTGSFNQVLTFTTNDPDEGTVNFNVTCSIGATGAQDFASSPVSPGPLSITVGQNGLGTASVLVSNAGDTTALGITAIAISGPDAATFSVNPNTPTSLAPSAQQNYVVTCNTAAIGMFNATLTFTTDDADEASVPFTLTCMVGAAQPALSSSPPVGQNIALTDVIGPGNVTATLTVTNSGSGALDVASVAGLSGVLSIAPSQQLGIAAGASRAFTITCDPVAAATVSQTLTLTTNATPATYDYPVSCTGTNAPAGEFDPNVPNGNTITINTTINTTGSSVVTVINSGTLNLSATASITLGGPAITVAPTAAQTINPGLPRVFTVSCLSAAPGVVSGTLNFATNDPDEASVDYPVTCVVADVPPDINVTGSMTLNALVLGPPVQSTLAVANTAVAGGNTLVATASGLSNPLSLSPAGFNVAPTASSPLTVTCTPGVIVIPIPPFGSFTFPQFGTFTQTLSFDTNDPDEDPANYTITCNINFAPAPEYGSTPVAGQTIVMNTVVGTPVSANLQVQNSGSLADTVTPSGLSGILAVNPNVATTVNPSGSVNFTITCSPTAPGTVTQTLAVTSTDTTDNEALNNYQVTCNAGIAPEPEINPTPASGTLLSLGGSPGTTSSAAIGITNSGNATLRIQACTLTGTGLTLTSVFPLDIVPGDSNVLAFQCQVPPIGLPTTGSLSCTTNDLDEGTIAYPVSCAGGLSPTEFIPTLSAWSRALMVLLLATLGLAGVAWQRRRLGL